ncbi:threonine synthase [Parvularcula marina]|uniref:Threonine synthase n=1 Tax=Parvularcula marina TaxID=2292771 RepID=A0A371RHS2_9PROT|nr:threonine synthase [Parvularcula marina]RFB04999.1 threonine synthase [Parvularcula marina]
MTYLSTRGAAPQLSFDDVLLTGLAPDGGLYVPEVYPTLDPSVIEGLRGRPYIEVAEVVIRPFSPEGDFHLEDAYRSFAHPAVTPLVQTGAEDFLLELFHGPTLAFKDVAMQWLGPMFSSRLAAAGRRMTIVCATSGDTGGAAIEAMAGRENISICVLHPNEAISNVQRRFMTTVESENVLNLAVEGSFDDCQRLVKEMFAHDAFRQAVSLGAVNSINWARIVAQTVYYVTSSLTLGGEGRLVSYCVPTGNFGDIFAGFVAKQLGAPIGQLIIATNENDILDRTLRTGRYEVTGVVKTQSPSMDIQVSSNFERLIHAASGGDAELVTSLMGALKQSGSFTLPDAVRARMAEDFLSFRVSEEAVSARMSKTFSETAMLVDPHTAVGLEAAAQARVEGLKGPLVTLSTAHPAKFPDAVKTATGREPSLPPGCRDLYSREERFEVIGADLESLEKRISTGFGTAE